MNNTDKAEEYHVRNGDHEKTIIMKLPKTYEEQVNILVPPYEGYVSESSSSGVTMSSRTPDMVSSL